MLKTRIITTLVFLSVFFPLTLLAPFSLFNALVALVFVLAAFEWARLLEASDIASSILYAFITMLIFVATTRISIGDMLRPLFATASIFWIIISPFVLWHRPTLTRGIWKLFLLIAGFILLTACWHAIVIARLLGGTFMLSLLIVVWIADTGAYFIGKIFGKHKFAPLISPGKTWEGAVGGLFSVLVVAGTSIAAHLFEPTLFSELVLRYQISGMWIILTFLVIFSIFGDLFESLLKRQAGLKDSSGLFPGHGGVLDRIDSLLPVLPLVMLLL